MPIILSLLNDLEQQIPLGLAESWDNVGLLWGDADAEATGVMTCLTLTEDVAREANREGANLILSHPPIRFKAVQRVTAATTARRNRPASRPGSSPRSTSGSSPPGGRRTCFPGRSTRSDRRHGPCTGKEARTQETT